MPELTEEDQAWDNLITAAYHWSSIHMDQWEKVKFTTPFGEVYLTLSYQDPYPNSFAKVEIPPNDEKPHNHE